MLRQIDAVTGTETHAVIRLIVPKDDHGFRRRCFSLNSALQYHIYAGFGWPHRYAGEMVLARGEAPTVRLIEPTTLASMKRTKP